MKRVILLVICVCSALPCEARVITVDDDGPADFENIQAAIDDANDGDTIIVNPGTYTGPGNRDIDFLGKAITLRSTDPNDPNIVAATIIDCNGTEANPHRGFYFHTGEDSNSILEGITVTNGYGRYKSVPERHWTWHSCGGAISCDRSSPTIANCRLLRNTAGSGGAVFCYEASPSIQTCTICDNISQWAGGGIYCYYDSGPTISDCNINKNSAQWTGSAIFYDRGSKAIISNCIITENASPTISGSAVSCSGSTFGPEDYTMIVNCIISDNYSTGIRCSDASPQIINCTITSNIGEKGHYSAGIKNRYGRPLVANCIIWGNFPHEIMDTHNYQNGVTATYCDVRRGWPGDGNIDADPEFVDGSAGNYHLSLDSPCIHGGSPAFLATTGAEDVDGEPRLMGIGVDIGADEVDTTAGPILSVWPRGFVFASYIGGPNPQSQTLFVRNVGIDTLHWEIAETCSWLRVRPVTGESSGEYGQVTLDVDTSGLPPDSYVTTLTIIAGTADNSPQEIPVVLNLGGAKRRVPSQYPTIQGAIDASNDWDTVILARQKYTGDGNRDIDFRGKAITVRSTDPNDQNIVAATVVDCNGTEAEPHRAFVFESHEGPDSVLAGITIVNGFAASPSYSSGGAIYCGYGSPTITLCTFVGNRAKGGGGAVYSYSGADITNCYMKANSAESGGAVYLLYGRSTLSDCSITDNSADRLGGAVYCTGIGGSIVRCRIIGNSAGSGAGIACHNGEYLVDQCLISGNSATEFGGAVNCEFGKLTFANCTVSGNIASSASVLSCSRSANVTMRDSVLWNNRAGDGNDIVIAGSFTWGASYLTVSYTNIQPDKATYDPETSFIWWGPGNINADPCFFDTGHWEDPFNTPDDIGDDVWIDGDYHLKSQAGRWDSTSASWVKDDVTSPCIDAGDPMSPIGHESFPNGGIINMGAYGGTVDASKSYFGEPVCETIIAGDINGDCKVNFLDFRLMALHWLAGN